MAIADKLDYLLETKNQIKEKLIEKGISVGDTDSFRNYINKIEQLEKVSNCLTENPINKTEHIFQKIFKTIPKGICSFLNTINITSTINMFRDCVNLTELDLSGLDTSNVIQMCNMFYNCTSLTEVDLRGLDISSVTDMDYMFYNCSNLTEIDLRGLDISNVTRMEGMFKNCENLVTVNGILDFSNVGRTTDLFVSCNNLETIYIKNLKVPRGTVLRDCVKLSHASLVYLINNLEDNTLSSSVKTITLGSINLAKLTEEEIAVATEKNWTLS